MIKNKYKIEILPVTDEFLKEKRLLQDRGELVLLSDGFEIRHITYFTLNPGPTFFRGGHYHRNKEERFYLISGKLKIDLADIETGEEQTLEIEAGQRVAIYPLCAHKFTAISIAHVIEYYSSAYDADDDIPYRNFQ